MKQIKVTEKQKAVLSAFVTLLDKERGFSDVGFEDLLIGTKMEQSSLRGVIGSLAKRGLIIIDRRETEGYGNKSEMWIYYLSVNLEGLVPEWVAEGAEPIELI